MKTSRLLAVSALVLLGALAASPFVPKIVAAQTAIIQNTVSNCGFYSNTNCTPGVLHVYVQVSNSYQYGPNNQPSDFTVTVAAQNAAPVSFPGSQSGTNLSVLGQYSVTVAPLPGYAPAYSVGCNNSVINGGEATCNITEGAASAYTQAPVPYPYPYVPSVLACAPAQQTVGLGQSATFSAAGNVSGPFNWATPTRSYQAIGPVFTTTFSNTGTQIVTVSNSSQSASCTVTVVAGAVPVSYVSPTTPPAYAYASPVPQNLTLTTAPQLPNTGFEPMSATQLAVLLALLTALGIALTPYVRKTLVAIG